MADALQLLFRRGTKAQITNGGSLINGSISFAYDEPGIYLDLSPEEAGNTVGKRVRIGDFVTVQNLQVLQDAAQNKEVFSEQALYYSIDENMLMKYISKDNQFVLINDTTQIKADIDALEAADIAIRADISTLTTNLNTEITNRTDAVTNLQNQIDSITDGSGSSLKSLQEALNAEITARTNADTQHDNAIAAVTAKAGANETNIATLTAKVGLLPDNVSETIVEYFSRLISEEATRAKAAEKANADNIAANVKAINDVSDALDAEIARAKAAESTNANAITANTTAIESNDADILKLQQDLSAEVTRAQGAEEALGKRIDGVASDLATDKAALEAKILIAQETADRAEGKADDNATAIAENKTELEGKIEAVQNNLNTVNTDLSADITELNTNLGTTNANVSALDGRLTSEVTRAKDAESALGTRIDGVVESIADEAETRASEITRVEGIIDEVEKAVATNTANIGTVTNTANKNKADIQTLNGLISNNSEAISQEAKDRAAQDKAINDALTAEINRATQKEAELSASISKEVTDRDSAIAVALGQAKDYTDDEIAELQQQINDDIAAANAMTFKEIDVTSYTDLPATGNKAGDTYVATAKFGDVQIGDLLVCRVDQDASATWTDEQKKANFIHVETGYSTFNDSKLVVNSETGKIELQSHLDEVLGTIAVNSVSQNVTVATTGSGNDCTVTVGLVWATF